MFLFLSLLLPQLELLMCGQDEVDVSDWKANTTYRGEYQEYEEVRAKTAALIRQSYLVALKHFTTPFSCMIGSPRPRLPLPLPPILPLSLTGGRTPPPFHRMVLGDCGELHPRGEGATALLYHR